MRSGKHSKHRMHYENIQSDCPKMQTALDIHCLHTIFLGPVVQSVVSLTSLLRVISLTVLADSIYNILIFFAEKM